MVRRRAPIAQPDDFCNRQTPTLATMPRQKKVTLRALEPPKRRSHRKSRCQVRSPGLVVTDPAREHCFVCGGPPVEATYFP
jgi:hypothetical protein